MTSPRTRHAGLLALLGLAAILAGAIASRASAQTRADVLQVQEDIRFLVSGLRAYHTRTGMLPASLIELVRPMVNANGETPSPRPFRIPSRAGRPTRT